MAIDASLAVSAEQLLREAGTALYAAKERGRARLEQFNDELHARAEKRVQIESDLRAALRQSQLFVEYQPRKICLKLKDECVVGVDREPGTRDEGWYRSHCR